MTIEKIEKRICDRCGFTEVGTADPGGWAQMTSKTLGLHTAGADDGTVDICQIAAANCSNGGMKRSRSPSDVSKTHAYFLSARCRGLKYRGQAC